MSITHSTTERNNFAAGVQIAVDAGAGAGQCVLLAGAAAVSTLVLNDPSFGAPAAGVITLDVDPVIEDSSAVGNAAVVDSMEFQDSDGNMVFAGDSITGVGGGGDLELSKNPIAAGDTVQLASFTYTASV